MGRILQFEVVGKPQPAGSKSAFYNKKLKRALVVDANENAKPWQATVADAAAKALNGEGMLCGPLFLSLAFRVARPKGHFGTGKNEGRVKDSAPQYPTTKPDALKLTRAVEDAMTGIVYQDDAQIVCETIAKEYADAVNPIGVSVFVEEFDDAD